MADSSSPALPEIVFANASPRSIGGVSLFESSGAVRSGEAVAFTSEEALLRTAAARLRRAGFSILQISPQVVNIAGPPSLYEQVFDTTLVVEQRVVIKPGQVEDEAEFVECPDTDLPGLISTRGTDFDDVLEGVAIEEPVYFMESAFAPTKEYWHLRVPGDISAGVHADPAHRRGWTGRGVSVVMVDSGWYAHPYFTRRGYTSNPVVLGPAASNPGNDESGHGTGESANLFAVAPDISFTMVKINFVNSLGAFNAAVALNPDIISCSWGSSQPHPPLSAANQALGAAIGLTWSTGTVVVFSAGNGHWGFPGQHPDVISAGGVYMEPDGSLRASDYASGFASNIFPGRNCPDVSGLVGMQPGASYIMLPVEPGDDIDAGRAGGSHPPSDETAADDGWSSFSGTSAAAPQLAGVAALMKQACPRLTPAQIRSIMMSTATDVTTGANALGNVSGPGYDISTGAGLADASRAVSRARLACITIQPIRPPIQPIRPIEPIQPIRPPIRPPIGPVQPVAPIQPVQPPIRPPIGPVVRPAPPPSGPASAAQEAGLAAAVEEMIAAGYGAEEIDAWLEQQTGGTTQSVTPEEAAALEDAILDDDFEL